jgi:transposase
MEQIQRRKTRGRYNREFKSRTIELLRTSGKSRAQVGRDLGVPACTLKWWLDNERSTGMSKSTKPGKPTTRIEELEAENRRLSKENKILQMERDILKKAATWFAKESE